MNLYIIDIFCHFVKKKKSFKLNCVVQTILNSKLKPPGYSLVHPGIHLWSWHSVIMPVFLIYATIKYIVWLTLSSKVLLIINEMDNGISYIRNSPNRCIFHSRQFHMDHTKLTYLSYNSLIYNTIYCIYKSTK